MKYATDDTGWLAMIQVNPSKKTSLMNRKIKQGFKKGPKKKTKLATETKNHFRFDTAAPARLDAGMCEATFFPPTSESLSLPDSSDSSCPADVP